MLILKRKGAEEGGPRRISRGFRERLARITVREMIRRCEVKYGLRIGIFGSSAGNGMPAPVFSRGISDQRQLLRMKRARDAGDRVVVRRDVSEEQVITEPEEDGKSKKRERKWTIRTRGRKTGNMSKTSQINRISLTNFNPKSCLSNWEILSVYLSQVCKLQNSSRLLSLQPPISLASSPVLPRASDSFRYSFRGPPVLLLLLLLFSFPGMSGMLKAGLYGYYIPPGAIRSIRCLTGTRYRRNSGGGWV